MQVGRLCRFAVAMLVLTPAAVAEVAPHGPRIDAVMKVWARSDGPGCAVGVVQGGKLVHAKGYGMADLERQVPITPATVFDIGSTSKQFTAAAVLLLAQEGKLQLDDDVRKHLPELPALGSKPTTLRHLLHHTGGLRDYTTLLSLAGTRLEDVATDREAVAMLARQKARVFEPGSKYEYSNTGYFLLGQVVERVSQRKLAELTRDRIFAPLGMSSSLLNDDHTRLIPGRALPYAEKPGGGWRHDISQWEQTGDGAVMTTVLDLAKWDANFYEPKVGGRALLDALHERGKLADGEVLDYAAGLGHDSYRGQATVSHAGAWAGYRAQLERFPQLATSVIVLCNAASSDPPQLAHQIADIVLEKQLPPPAPVAAPVAVVPAAQTTSVAGAALDVWVGQYYRSASGILTSIARSGPGLTLTNSGNTFSLRPSGGHSFKVEGTDVVVEFSGVAPKRSATISGPNQPTSTIHELVPRPTSAAELARYVGRYHSGELGTEWILAVQKGSLVASGRGFDDDALLLPTRKDQFVSASIGVSLTFTRGPRGVTGFSVDAPGLKGIRFERQ